MNNNRFLASLRYLALSVAKNKLDGEPLLARAKAISYDADEQQIQDLEKMAEILPRHYGAARGKKWLEIMSQYFSTPEIVNIYLSPFPCVVAVADKTKGVVTKGERRAIHDYLVQSFGLTTEQADGLLDQRFGTKLKHKSRHFKQSGRNRATPSRFESVGGC